MKVTDCGCFGDFLKLEPKVSFFKDVFLLIPAFFFIFKNKDMHQLFNKNIRNILVGLTLVGTTIYCINNSVWNIPSTDFRPFKKGVNVAATKAAEEEAEMDVEITAMVLKNKSTDKIVTIDYKQYMGGDYKNYPKEEWTVTEQIKTEPAIARTKISDFSIYDADGIDMTEEILSREGYSFMLVANKLYENGFTTETGTKTQLIQYIDTVKVEGSDEIALVESFDTVTTTVPIKKYKWEDSYIQKYKSVINPLVSKAKDKGFPVFLITAYTDTEMINSLVSTAELEIPVYQADDILLKTIVRSNPGIVLMKDGVIVDKWHQKKFPGFESIDL